MKVRRSARKRSISQVGLNEQTLGAFQEWERQRRPPPPGPPGAATPCPSTPPERCAEITPAPGPEHILHFRQPVPLTSVEVLVGDPVEGQSPLRFACAPFAVGGITGELSLDLRYEQRWHFRKAVIGALSASVALAPGETLSLSVRNTQRKQFEQQTVDEVERSEQTESTVADKDVLNVTRSASKTNSWNISGNASITLPKFSAGISGSMSQTVTQASSSSAQRTKESTRKAATNLKTLQKIQVRESTEVTTEATSSRKITNPYRDRSLRLDVYELAKDYCVEFHLPGAVPVLVFDLLELDFSREFVLTNGAFLTDELIDRVLELELSQVLQLTTDLKSEGAEKRAEETALMALRYLFDGPVVFDFPEEMPFGWRPGSPEPWDENAPRSAFLAPLKTDWSGLYEGKRQKVGVIFSTLAVYYQLYQREVLPSTNGRLAVELAMSLDQVLAPRWIGVEETKEISAAIDGHHATEVLRRLGGFLTMTTGILRPLLEPAEQDRESRRVAERAEWVITRVVEHLRCHARYYTERFLHYMADRTRMQAVFRLVEEVLTGRLPSLAPGISAAFDPEAAFLDAHRVVVPLRVPPSPKELGHLMDRIDRGSQGIRLGHLDTDELTIPTDGVHIEPSAGSCELPGIPEEPVTEPVRIVVEKE